MFTAASNLLSVSGLSVELADRLLNDKGILQGLGRAFLNVEQKQGINAYFGIAQAILETGWGTSLIAVQKHNLFGLTAYDSNPYGDAQVFGTAEDCVAYWGAFLKKYYLTPKAMYYVSTTPAGVARHWASDPSYASKIVGIMNQLQSIVSTFNPYPVAPSPPTVVIHSANTYTVKPGDTLWGIAAHTGHTLSQLEAYNPQAGHPAGNFNNIFPGDVLHLPSAASPQPSYQTEPVYITVPPAPEGDLSNLAQKYHTTVQQVVEWNKDKYPQIAPDYVQVGWYLRVG